MKNPRFWLAVFVAGVVGNCLDMYVQGNLLMNAYYSKLACARTDSKPIHYVIGDFVAVIVLAWVINRVRGSFAGGAAGGAAAGFYLGVLVSFPGWHFIFLMVKDYPYSLAWINTLYGIVWYIIAGAILGAMTCKSEPAA